MGSYKIRIKTQGLFRPKRTKIKIDRRSEDVIGLVIWERPYRLGFGTTQRELSYSL